MSKWTFTVPGPIKGYRKDVRYSHSHEYKAFKTLVRAQANLAGVPDQLNPDGIYSICTEFYWPKRPRIDISNAHKAIEDGLFTQDRAVHKIAAYHYPHTNREEIHVTVERLL